MKYLIGFTSIALFFLSSCSGLKSEYDKLIEENALLQQKMNNLSEEEKALKGEYSSAMDALNTIEDSLNSISERDKDIQKLTKKIDETKDLTQKQAILKKLQALQNANDNSKNEARALQSKLNSYRIENEQLRKMIAQAETRLLAKERELEDAQKVLDGLRSALSKMEAQLLESKGELASAYEELKKKNEELTNTNQRLNNTLEDLKTKSVFIDEQAVGYVSCGTKKALRKNGVLSTTSIKLTKDYQLAVKENSSTVNYFETDVLECAGDSKIEALLPERDPSSYSIEGGKVTVKNNESFWKTSKIVVLVIE
jgi:chromosome segregation ATPase